MPEKTETTGDARGFFGLLLSARTSTDLPSLFQLCKHDYGAASPLPDHPPEVLHGVLQRTLACHVGVLLTVPLWTEKEDEKDGAGGGKKSPKRPLQTPREHLRALTSIKEALT